jgi:hypothetical protein
MKKSNNLVPVNLTKSGKPRKPFSEWDRKPREQ